MKTNLVLLIICILISGCGSSGSWSGMISSFLGELRVEAQALGVVVEQEFTKAIDEGILIVVREKESQRMICQTTFHDPVTAGRLTQFMPFVKSPGIKYQVQLTLGGIATPWTDI